MSDKLVFPAKPNEAYTIPLTKGYTAIVDEEDYREVSSHLWHAFVNRSGKVYACRRLNGKVLYMHRVLLNAPEGADVDHVDGNGLNNRRVNLRLATKSTNGANRSKQSNNTSGYKGVYWFEGRHKWVAQIAGKHIGVFDDVEDAAKAYDQAAVEKYGEFASLNFGETICRIS